jgi:hypothetical protein
LNVFGGRHFQSISKGFFWDLQHFQVQLTPGHAPHQGLEAALASWSYSDGDVVSPESASSGGSPLLPNFWVTASGIYHNISKLWKFIIIFTHTLW